MRQYFYSALQHLDTMTNWYHETLTRRYLTPWYFDNIWYLDTKRRHLDTETDIDTNNKKKPWPKLLQPRRHQKPLRISSLIHRNPLQGNEATSSYSCRMFLFTSKWTNRFRTMTKRKFPSFCPIWQMEMLLYGNSNLFRRRLKKV
jgi:hypothetical protein